MKVYVKTLIIAAGLFVGSFVAVYAAGQLLGGNVWIDTGQGFLGIGVQNPTTRLDIDGEMQITGLKVNGDIWTSGDIVSSSTTDGGWSVMSSANQACNTTCTNACMVGYNTGTLGIALPHIVSCTDATADECACAGAN